MNRLETCWLLVVVLDDMDQAEFLQIQKAVAEPNRLEILGAIRDLGAGTGVSCSDVLARMNISQSTFSHHISELVTAGLVDGVKDGRVILLTVNERTATAYIAELNRKILGK